MKRYINIQIAIALILLVFPFFSFPELIENILISFLGFILIFVTLSLQKESREEKTEEQSLQDYIRSLKEKFKEVEKEKEEVKAKSINDIEID